ncbi:MAG: hypothetical protein ACK56I_11640, partial [bacterium]
PACLDAWSEAPTQSSDRFDPGAGGQVLPHAGQHSEELPYLPPGSAAQPDHLPAKLLSLLQGWC